MNERQRQQSIQRYQILGTMPEEAFDEITRLAADICQTPIAMISFVDNSCMWFKSHIGTDLCQIDRNHSFCNYTIRDTKTLVVPDATLDRRFNELPVVVDGPKVRFYAGAPLIAPDGVVIGSLCVLATEPQNLTETQVKSLERLARLVVQFLESRVVDIGEKQAAQQDLEKQKEFADAVLENLSDSVIACDAEGNVHVFNEASRQFQRERTFKEHEWVDEFKVMNAAGDRQLSLEELPLYRALQGEIVKNAEILLRTSNGELRRLLTNGRALFNRNGEKMGAVLTMRDITEVRNAESREQATSMTLRTLIDLAPVAITMLDENNCITTWNRASEDITEWKEAEVLGRNIYEAFEGNSANSERIHNQVNERNEKFSDEMEYITKSGKKVDLKISVVPLFDGQGRQMGSMGVSVNISDLRERERRLMDANRVLKEASAAKSDFLANMSHEIRTPLNGVIAMSELVMMTPLSAEQKEMMGTVQSSAHSLLTILSDILDFSKVEAGKLEIESVSFDLKELIQQSLRTVEPVAQSKKLALRVSVPLDMHTTFKGDPGRIRQVLVNLVSNAVKFTEQGEISTAISLSPAGDGKTTLRVEILDTGIGMSKAQISKLFRAFSQADASTTRKFGGTGLGLSICHGLIELMKGQIGVESAEGQGSKFWFTLPLEVADLPKAGATVPLESVPQNQFLKGKHILIAEDNMVNQRIATAMVAKLGATCDVVENGLMALQALKLCHYDLILMDCQMPEMDGYDATRAIRLEAVPGCKDIPIVALTAHAMAGDREKCIDAGMNDYLSKPLILQNLTKVLGEVTKAS